MSYTDVYVLPVPRAKAADYQKLAELGAQVWREHGALGYVELEADDVKAGKWTSFPQSVDLQDGEYVVISFITYRDRAHRDEVNAKAMNDPRFAGMNPKTMPFDGKRMFWGGFRPFVEAPALSAPAVQPYLFFRGRCEEAIQYYKTVLGAEVGMMLRFRDNPDKPPRDKVPAALDDRIMHAEISVQGTAIMMSDGMRSGPLDFQCMSLSLSVASEAEADRLYNALAADGTIQMPIGPTFFAKRFGAVADKFGVSWMIMVAHDAGAHVAANQGQSGSEAATRITVETTVAAPIEKVWRAYTTPADIKRWNAASDDWHTTKASVDLRVGGAFSSRMEAKDGSMGFDFEGTYTRIVEHKLIEYAFGDRKAEVAFTPGPKGVAVRVAFDSEPTHSVEQQRSGWQAILDRFKRHVEAKSAKARKT